jgi:hypothetical protein
MGVLESKNDIACVRSAPNLLVVLTREAVCPAEGFCNERYAISGKNKSSS